MINKNMANNRDGILYIKNQVCDIFINYIAVDWTEKEKDNTANAILNLFSFKEIANYWIYYRLISYCSDDILALRWRRLISALTEVTINCALFSPSAMYFSISSTTSCGNLAFNCCDLAFLEPVAIAELLIYRCDSVYTKGIIKKELKCDSIASKVNRTLSDSRQKRQRPEVLGTTIEASNHNVKETYAMADTRNPSPVPH